MAHSLEIRVPFLDHRLVNFVLNLSMELKIRHGWTKYVLRKVMSDLPAGIRWRKDKQGFLTPEMHWLLTGFSGTIQSTFRHSLLGAMGVIDDARFLEQYARFRGGDRTMPHSLFTRGWMAEVWARRVFQ